MLFFERFMYIDGMTPLNCVMTARLRGMVDGAQLQAALNKIQAKHPLLRAHVIDEAGEPSFLISDEIPLIPVREVSRTSQDLWQSVTAAEWKEPFNTRLGPLLRLIWIRSEDVSELMLVGHHCVCDGGSMMTLIRELLQVLDKPETRLVPYTSYASLADLVPSDVLADLKIRRRVSKKAMLYKLLLAVLGRRKAKFAVGDPYVLYWCAGVEEFAAISSRCTVEDSNTYAALCVAFLLAYRHVQGNAARNKIMCPVSIRRFIRSVKSDMLFAFAPTIELSLAKDAHADFWSRTRQMKQAISEKIDAMNVYEDLMLGDAMLPWVSNIINFLCSSRGGHDIAFSNVGRLKIPSNYTHFNLEAILGATVSVPWRNTNTLIMTYYLNELELGFISNERFLPQREARAILDKAVELLQQAMLLPVTVKSVIEPTAVLAPD